MSGLGRFPGGGNGNTLQVFLPGKSHGERSLAVYIQLGSQRVRHDWAVEHIIIIKFDCPSVVSEKIRIPFKGMKPLKTNHILNYFFPCWKTIGNKLTVNYCSQVSPTKIPVFLSQKDKFCIIATDETCNACTVAVEISVQTLSWLLLNVAPGERRGTHPMWCGGFTLRGSTTSLREGSGRCPLPSFKAGPIIHFQWSVY